MTKLASHGPKASATSCRRFLRNGVPLAAATLAVIATSRPAAATPTRAMFCGPAATSSLGDGRGDGCKCRRVLSESAITCCGRSLIRTRRRAAKGGGRQPSPMMSRTCRSAGSWPRGRFRHQGHAEQGDQHEGMQNDPAQQRRFKAGGRDAFDKDCGAFPAPGRRTRLSAPQKRRCRTGKLRPARVREPPAWPRPPGAPP